MKKWVIASICVFLLGGTLYLGYPLFMNLYVKPRTRALHQYSYPLACVLGILLDFGKANDGRLPESQQELIDQGLIRKTCEGEVCFWEYLVDDGLWGQLPEFDGITINYGLQIADVHIMDETLRLRETGEEVFFFRGPPDFYLDHLYRGSSVRLYRLLHQKELKGSRN